MKKRGHKSKNGNIGNGQAGPSWHISNVLTNLDFFGKDIPSFNIKGEGRVNTIFGGIVTSSIIMLTLAYTLLKFSDLYTKDNPVISEMTIEDYYSPTDALSLKDINFKFAFTVESYYKKKRKDDPRFVKSFFRLNSKNNGVPTSRVIPFHECS